MSFCRRRRPTSGRRRTWSSTRDRKSTRLNSSHITISYAVFCLKKKNKNKDKVRSRVKRIHTRRQRKSNIQGYSGRENVRSQRKGETRAQTRVACHRR